MEITKRYESIEKELKLAKEKHPNYPKSIFEQLAILTEEAGEVAKAVNDYSYDNGPLSDVRDELSQTAAMCVRMLESLPSEELEQSDSRKESFTKKMDKYAISSEMQDKFNCLGPGLNGKIIWAGELSKAQCGVFITRISPAPCRIRGEKSGIFIEFESLCISILVS